MINDQYPICKKQRVAAVPPLAGLACASRAVKLFLAFVLRQRIEGNDGVFSFVASNLKPLTSNLESYYEPRRRTQKRRMGETVHSR